VLAFPAFHDFAFIDLGFIVLGFARSDPKHGRAE